jgi:hypothetical protein
LRFEASLGKKFVRPYLQKTLHKNRAGGVAQGESPEFKLQYCQKKKKGNSCLITATRACLREFTRSKISSSGYTTSPVDEKHRRNQGGMEDALLFR